MCTFIHKTAVYTWIWVIILFVASSCSHDEYPTEPVNNPEVKYVSIAMNIETPSVRAMGDPTQEVNRVLFLPYKKVDEGGENVDSNFMLDESKVLQVNVEGLPHVQPSLGLTIGSTYKVVVLGYNRTESNYNDASLGRKRFTINKEASLDNLEVTLATAALAPELFAGICGNFTDEGTALGEYFRPDDADNVRAHLLRKVSGVSVTITAVPSIVESISLVAGQLVDRYSVLTGAPQSSVTRGDATLLGTQVPVDGTVTIESFVLPAQVAQQTELYLVVNLSDGPQEYTVAVEDRPGVVSSNNFVFNMNEVVRITGNFTVTGITFESNSNNVNLDDDVWDGHEE